MRNIWKYSIGLVALITLTVGVRYVRTHIRQWGHSLRTPPLPLNLVEKGFQPATLSQMIPPAVLNHSLDICQNFYRVVCQKSGEIHDPTGTVRPDVEGEKAAMRLYKEIIQQHRDWTPDQVDEALVQQIFEPKRRGRIESAFRWVQHDMQQFIDRQSDMIFTLQEKRQLKARLQKTQLQLPPPASVYADEPDLFTKGEAYYERTQGGELRLRVGGAYVLFAKSWFNLVDTLAHELAHAIDPCEIRNAHLAFPAYDRLIACFLRSGLIETRKNRSECGANDQLSEIFADWVAAQVIADALALFSTEFHGQQIINAARNSIRDLCEQDEENNDLDLEFHPSPQIRIQHIFGDHPTIRTLLGCAPLNERPQPFTPVSTLSPNLDYCTFDSTRAP